MENERDVGRRGEMTSVAANSNFGEGGKCDGRGPKSMATNMNVGPESEWGGRGCGPWRVSAK